MRCCELCCWRSGVEWGWDANVWRRLKLQVYRSLGIGVSQDAATGDFNRAVIRNQARGDVNVVNVNEEVGKSFYANMFWESL